MREINRLRKENEVLKDILSEITHGYDSTCKDFVLVRNGINRYKRLKSNPDLLSK